MEPSSKKQTLPKSKFFPEHEFRCRCGTGCGTGFDQMQIVLLNRLYAAREAAGVPFTINSAYRCGKHPESIKRPNSAHTRGFAVDIATPNSQIKFEVEKALLDAGFVRIGYNQRHKFIHVDCDPSLPQRVSFDY